MLGSHPKAFLFFATISGVLALGAPTPALAKRDGHGHEHGHGHHKNKHKHGPHCQQDHGHQNPCAPGGRLEIEAGRILGGHKLYFSTERLLPFLTSGQQLLDAELWLLVEGRKTGVRELTLSVNGIRAQHANGRGHAEVSQHFGDDTVALADLHPLRLNGSEPALRFMKSISLRKGVLSFWVKGPYKVKRAKLILTSTPNPECSPDPEPPVAPKVTITSVTPAESPTRLTDATFAFEADQTGVSFRCGLDGAAPELCSSPWAVSGLAAGSHRFEVVAVSAAGLSSSPAAHSWSIDNSAVDVSIDSVLPAEANTSSDTITLGFSSSKGAVTFRCRLDAGAWVACVSPVTYSQLSDGAHTVEITGTDALGNTSATPAHHAWTVDRVAPVVSFAEITGAEKATRATAASFRFGADESATFECSLDGQAFAPCVSPAGVTALAEGAHQFAVRATDAAGNMGAAAVHAWAVDLTPPRLAFGNVVPAPGLTNARGASAELGADEPVTYTCAIDGAAAFACASPVSFSFPGEGGHTLLVTATDAAGNSSAVAAAWVVDFTAPLLSFGTISPSAAAVISSSTLTVGLVGSEAFGYRAVLDGQQLAQAAGSTIQLEGLADGPHSLQIFGFDAAGNASLPLTHSFTVDTVAPSVWLASQQGSLTKETTSVFTISSSEAVQLECNLDLGGFAPCEASFTATGLAEGGHSLTVRGTDAAGLVSAAATYSWAVDLTAPVVAVQGAAAGATGYTFTLASSESATAFLCSLDGSAWAACSSPHSVSSLAVGGHNFSVKGTDAAGNEGAPLSYPFSIESQDVVTTKIDSVDPSASVTNFNVITFTFSSPSPGASFVCSLDGGDAVPCTSPQTYGGIVDGTHNFLVRAVSASGKVDPVGAAYSWTVDSSVPLITSIQTSVTRTSLTISWITNDPTTGQIAWGLSPPPPTNTTVVNTSPATFHTMTLTGLQPNTVYIYVISGTDLAGNKYSSTTRSVRTAP